MKYILILYLLIAPEQTTSVAYQAPNLQQCLAMGQAAHLQDARVFRFRCTPNTTYNERAT